MGKSGSQSSYLMNKMRGEQASDWRFCLQRSQYTLIRLKCNYNFFVTIITSTQIPLNQSKIDMPITIKHLILHETTQGKDA
jgi:hypothetical protein